MRLSIEELLTQHLGGWDTPNSGTSWSTAQDLHLVSLVRFSLTVDEIAKKLGRTRGSILARLVSVEILKHSSCSKGYVYMSSDTGCKTVPTQSSAPLLETRVYVNGRLASDMTDEEIFAAIKKTEDKIAGYKDIVTKPEKLKAMVAKMQSDVTELAKYVDGR